MQGWNCTGMEPRSPVLVLEAPEPSLSKRFSRKLGCCGVAEVNDDHLPAEWKPALENLQKRFPQTKHSKLVDSLERYGHAGKAALALEQAGEKDLMMLRVQEKQRLASMRKGLPQPARQQGAGSPAPSFRHTLPPAASDRWTTPDKNSQKEAVRSRAQERMTMA